MPLLKTTFKIKTLNQRGVKLFTLNLWRITMEVQLSAAICLGMVRVRVPSATLNMASNKKSYDGAHDCKQELMSFLETLSGSNLILAPQILRAYKPCIVQKQQSQ